jgi:bifunctional UDP-N-acetylglucosamine pyrophosphorylase/glucosamine-1-phosphate N-acetyltransferase
VAAGSTVTEHVPAGALAIARGRQSNKPGWAARKRRELAAEEKPRKAPRRSKKAKPRRAKKRRR